LIIESYITFLAMFSSAPPGAVEKGVPKIIFIKGERGEKKNILKPSGLMKKGGR